MRSLPLNTKTIQDMRKGGRGLVVVTEKDGEERRGGMVEVVK